MVRGGAEMARGGAEMARGGAEMARATGIATVDDEPRASLRVKPRAKPPPEPDSSGCGVGPRSPSPRALSPRAPSASQLLEQLSAAPTSQGGGAAQPALGSDLFEGQLQGRTMASMYVWLAVSLVYYGLSLSAGHMGGGNSASLESGSEAQ